MRAPRDMARSPLPSTDPPLASRPGAPVWSPADRMPSPARGPRGEVIPFRRRHGLPVRRRSRLASLARPFLAAVAIVGIPAAALWWSGTSPRFALADLEVRGSARVSEDWVRGQLASLLGRNLVWMPLDSVERTLSSHPWVDGVEVTKELPDRLRVAVVERIPAAVLVTPDARFWVGEDGAVIAPMEAGEPPAEVLEVRWAADTAGSPMEEEGAPARRQRILAAALDAVEVLDGTAQEWGRALSAVEVLGDEELRLEGSGVPFPLLVRSGGAPEALGGRPDELATRLRRLQQILPKLLTRQPEPASVDLRFRNRIVVRPAVAATTEGQKRGA